MKTNRVLLGGVMLILSAWGAAQFLTVSVDYLYRPMAAARQYQREAACWFDRGGVSLLRGAAEGGFIYSPRTRIVQVRAQPDNNPAHSTFRGPWLANEGPLHELFLPYWLLVVPPAAWLVWRLYRARPSTRGFEVATA